MRAGTGDGSSPTPGLSAFRHFSDAAYAGEATLGLRRCKHAQCAPAEYENEQEAAPCATGGERAGMRSACPPSAGASVRAAGPGSERKPETEVSRSEGQRQTARALLTLILFTNQ